MPFASLGLAPELVRAVADEGYEQPTPIQQEAIPLALAGRDLIGSAQTGTGKTAAFMLPILQRLSRNGVKHVLRALILVPTRSEEHTSELQSLAYLVCRLLLEKKKKSSHGCPVPVLSSVMQSE